MQTFEIEVSQEDIDEGQKECPFGYRTRNCPVTRACRKIFLNCWTHYGKLFGEAGCVDNSYNQLANFSPESGIVDWMKLADEEYINFVRNKNWSTPSSLKPIKFIATLVETNENESK